MSVVDPARLRSTVEHLASFPTRNSLSRGVWDACEWLSDLMREIPGVEVELMRYVLPQGRRVPEPTECVQVVATLPGATDRIVALGAHIDSLNLSVDPLSGPAPGANDDASGVAACLEVLRAAANRKWNQTIKVFAFSGEEQGLLGAKALAARARTEGWKLEALLNNDTVGSSSNLSGQSDRARVRVFSEANDAHCARELARFAEWQVRQTTADFSIKLVLRKDRFGRGGDHTPFADAGFSAVRFVEVHEEYARQHTPDDLVEHMDFEYLAKVAEANLATIEALASAALPPKQVTIVRDQSHDTTLEWAEGSDARHLVYWRDTASPVWQGVQVAEQRGRALVQRVNKDDHEFAVGVEGGIPVPVAP